MGIQNENALKPKNYITFVRLCNGEITTGKM